MISWFVFWFTLVTPLIHSSLFVSILVIVQRPQKKRSQVRPGSAAGKAAVGGSQRRRPRQGAGGDVFLCRRCLVKSFLNHIGVGNIGFYGHLGILLELFFFFTFPNRINSLRGLSGLC